MVAQDAFLEFLPHVRSRDFVALGPEIVPRFAGGKQRAVRADIVLFDSQRAGR